MWRFIVRTFTICWRKRKTQTWNLKSRQCQKTSAVECGWRTCQPTQCQRSMRFVLFCGSVTWTPYIVADVFNSLHVQQIRHLLNISKSKRATATTNANERSSRSHSVFILKIEATNDTTGEEIECESKCPLWADGNFAEHAGCWLSSTFNVKVLRKSQNSQFNKWSEYTNSSNSTKRNIAINK